MSGTAPRPCAARHARCTASSSATSASASPARPGSAVHAAENENIHAAAASACHCPSKGGQLAASTSAASSAAAPGQAAPSQHAHHDLCCELAPDNSIDHATAQAAIARLAADYRRWLTPEDYSLLCEIDRTPEHGGNNKQAQDLLHRLALMEYNDGSWRRSHPVVRTLEGYVKAAAQ